MSTILQKVKLFPINLFKRHVFEASKELLAYRLEIVANRGGGGGLKRSQQPAPELDCLSQHLIENLRIGK